MRLLIVEDEQKIAHSLKKGFTQEDFAVDTAFDGEKGFDLAYSENYDVIILDLMLPKIDGFTILKKLREHQTYTPVIILTARGALDDKVKGLDIGADDYLAKPFSFEELLARVRALIRRSKNNHTILKVDTLELDPTRKVIQRNGNTITLTSKEYALLEYLLRHNSGIVSESEILDHVWDYDYDGLSNVVAVHIKNLRKKIDTAFPKEKPLMHTIRGLGYSIRT
jgi:DNA-binding response OmpR family regulator